MNNCPLVQFSPMVIKEVSLEDEEIVSLAREVPPRHNMFIEEEQHPCQDR